VAIFNWLFTRRHGGSFVIRVEDTDVDRNVVGAEDMIYEDLRWLGVDWDEGPDRGGPYGPYRQSERLDRYRAVAHRLVDEGKAYPCFCSEADLESEREVMSGGVVHRYSGRCRELSAGDRSRLTEQGETPAIRFAMPSGDIEISDDIRGEIRFLGNEFGDFILLRSDGRPTYNFAVVVDDIEMEITHVIRGVGHLSNTPKQAVLFDALAHPRPVFAHLPMVLGADRRKLSKREGAAAIADLREYGYHPQGVVNYLSLLGWSSPDEREILTGEELIDRTSLDRVGLSDTVFDPEKLRWVSSQHIAEMTLPEVVQAVGPWVDSRRYPFQGEALEAAVAAIRTRLSAFSDINECLALVMEPAGPQLAEAHKEVREDPEARRVLTEVQQRLEATDEWREEELKDAVREAGKACGVRGPALFHPLRKALTGAPSGPDLGKMMFALGKDEVMARIERTLRPSS
jgi:nondiscriminating glutamyl-tRNA synthetase